MAFSLRAIACLLGSALLVRPTAALAFGGGNEDFELIKRDGMHSSETRKQAVVKTIPWKNSTVTWYGRDPNQPPNQPPNSPSLSSVNKRSAEDLVCVDGTEWCVPTMYCHAEHGRTPTCACSALLDYLSTQRREAFDKATWAVCISGNDAEWGKVDGSCGPGGTARCCVTWSAEIPAETNLERLWTYADLMNSLCTFDKKVAAHISGTYLGGNCVDICLGEDDNYCGQPEDFGDLA